MAKVSDSEIVSLNSGLDAAVEQPWASCSHIFVEPSAAKTAWHYKNMGSFNILMVIFWLVIQRL